MKSKARFLNNGSGEKETKNHLCSDEENEKKYPYLFGCNRDGLGIL